MGRVLAEQTSPGPVTTRAGRSGVAGRIPAPGGTHSLHATGGLLKETAPWNSRGILMKRPTIYVGERHLKLYLVSRLSVFGMVAGTPCIVAGFK